MLAGAVKDAFAVGLVSATAGATFAGGFTWNSTTRKFWSAYYDDTPRGELKRHTIAFTGQGTSASTYWYGYSFRHLLVFDVATGEHLLIEAAEWKAATRPRIMAGTTGPMSVTDLGKRTSGTTTFPVTNFTQIPQWIDQ